MQERQVTVEGRPSASTGRSHVLATANPVEYEGTYPLPEAQLDRFLAQISFFWYPTDAEERDILLRRMERRREEVTVDQVTDGTGLEQMQGAIETVTVDPTITRYCVDLARATRTHGHVLMGASPRGSLALLLVGRAYAVLRGRDYVVPEDVKAVAVPVLAHRVTIRPSCG